MFVCACEPRVSALERAKGMPRVGWHIVVLIKNKPRAAALEAKKNTKWATVSEGGKEESKRRGVEEKGWLDAQIERKLLNI